MAETGKDRTRRIDSDYHRRVDAPVRLKRGLSLLAACLGIGYAGYILYASVVWQRSGALSTGDLSQAHAAWNSADCENCHTPNIPIRTDALWGTEPHHIQLNNQKCATCHSAAGHFAAHTLEEVRQSESCSSCHREHLGLEHDLAHVADGHCVRCHADLTIFAAADRSGQRADVTSFSAAGGHPEFRSLESDPGTLAFSHIQHMRPGQPLAPGDKTAMTFVRLPDGFKPQYAARVDPATGFVRLDCGDCHEPDSARPDWLERPASSVAATGDHRFYQPIRFERHCAACHQLPFDLPHGSNRKATLDSLEKWSDHSALKEVTNREPRELATIRRKQAMAILDGDQVCTKCHQRVADPNGDHLVVPGRIPQRWFEGAIFSHGAHQGVQCAVCHAQAYTQSNDRASSRSEASAVMIGGLQVCVRCHLSQLAERAARMENGETQLASGECIECHRYHVDLPAAKALAFTQPTRFISKSPATVSEGPLEGVNAIFTSAVFVRGEGRSPGGDSYP